VSGEERYGRGPYAKVTFAVTLPASMDHGVRKLPDMFPFYRSGLSGCRSGGIVHLCTGSPDALRET